MFTTTPGSRLAQQFQEYESFHRHPMNKRLHYAGVPLIMFSLLGMLSFWKLGQNLDGGFVLWGFAAAYYFAGARRLGLVFSGLAFLMYLAARTLPFQVHVALFLGGWIIQAVGHARYERNKPAFIKNLEHLLIGPLWLFSRLLPGRN